jgi:outer membrane protein assembly factor BamB
MKTRAILAVVVGLALVAAACGSSGGDSGSAGGGMPAEVARGAHAWPLPNRDYANTRAADGSPIDRGTVASLAVAWKVPLPGTGTFGNASTNPVIVGDRVYLEDLVGKVRAIDLRTGRVMWTTDVSDSDGKPLIGPNGVAVADGLVFAVAGRGGVAAIEAASGQVSWRQTITTSNTLGIDIQPTAFDGMVFVSTVPISINGIYQGGDRGVLFALAERDGSTVWTFDTVGSKDLWGDPSVNSGGGAWYPPAIDPRTKLMYWGIGNPAPFPGAPGHPNGTSRPGPNPYTNSTLALDATTGKLRWYRQAVPHDIFDHDHQLTLIASSRKGPVVIGTGKDGLVYGLDPSTGAVRWKRSVGVHENDQLTALAGPTKVLPGNLGGVETPPAAAGGVVYLPVINEPTTYTADSPGLSGNVGTMDGEMVALDAATGAVKWDAKVPGDPFGGATVVGDLVFTGLNDGRLIALSTRDGSMVWSYQSSGTVNAWPAVAGDTIVWPLGGATPAHVLALRVTRRTAGT